MLKHGLLLAILIINIIHVTFGGITESKGSVLIFLILSQFLQIFLWQENLLECIYNSIMAMGFSAMFTFQLDNTKR